MSDTRPANCRFRLQDEGKAFPKSSCQACGKTIVTGLGNRCMEAAQSTPTTSTKSEDVAHLDIDLAGVEYALEDQDLTITAGVVRTSRDTLRALLAERDTLRKENASLRETLTSEWGDERDEFTDEIEAAHPFREPKDFRRYNLAQAMVSSRRSKLELIKLVAWLLTFKAEQERARAALGVHQ